MPTGYTAGVADGTITDFRMFALQCARNFGACVIQRDDPADELPKERQVSPHYITRLEEAQGDLARYRAMSFSDAAVAMAAEYQEQLAQYERWEHERQAENGRYQAMRRAAEKWTPPTPEHKGLQKFMLEQLDISMDRYASAAPELAASPETWLKSKREKAAHDVEYHAKMLREEVDRCENAAAWTRALYASLAPVGAGAST